MHVDSQALQHNHEYTVIFKSRDNAAEMSWISGGTRKSVSSGNVISTIPAITLALTSLTD